MFIHNSFWLLLIFACACNQQKSDESSITETPDKSGIVNTYTEKDVVFIDLCDAKDGKDPLDADTLMKYGKLNPFNFQRNTFEKKTTISFDFIEACCQDFFGYYRLNEDTLLMCYGLVPMVENSICECYCEYRMQYTLPSDSLGDKSIVVKHFSEL